MNQKISGLDLLVDAVSLGFKKSLRSSGVISTWLLYLILMPVLYVIMVFICIKLLALTGLTAFATIPQSLSGFVKLYWVFALMLPGLWYAYVTVGYKKAMLDVYDTQRTSGSVLFSGSIRQTIFMAVATLFYAIINVLGLLLFIIPGLIFMARFALFPFFIIEKDADPVSALRMSWRITKGYTLMSLGLLLFSNIIKILLPWHTLANIHCYRQLTQQTMHDEK